MVSFSASMEPSACTARTAWYPPRADVVRSLMRWKSRSRASAPTQVPLDRRPGDGVGPVPLPRRGDEEAPRDLLHVGDRLVEVTREVELRDVHGGGVRHREAEPA